MTRKKAKHRPAVGSRSRGLSMGAQALAAEIALSKPYWRDVDGRYLRSLLRHGLVRIKDAVNLNNRRLEITGKGTRALDSDEWPR